MKRIALFMLFGGLLAAGVTKTPVAQAYPSTVGDVAAWVCTQLTINPTVDEMRYIVNVALPPYNTQEQENNVMAYAMNTACPQFRSLAVQSALDEAHQQNLI